jgi:hypothetical protein
MVNGRAGVPTWRSLMTAGTFLALLSAVILWSSTPPVQRIPRRDSSIYLYIGEQILAGQLPYRDIWDHKGPVIYYLNALGLYLTGGSRWGVWALELLSLFAAAKLGFILMRESFGALPAIWGSALWLFSLSFVLQGGNHTEEFGLPFQFLAIYALTRMMVRREVVFWPSLLLGAASATLLLLRPNLIGIPLATVLYLAMRAVAQRRWNLTVPIAYTALGALAVLLAWLAYFAAHHALGDFLECVINYNMAYSRTTTLWEHITAPMVGLYVLSVLSVIALLSWVVGLAYLMRRPRELFAGGPVFFLALIGLPLEGALASASGRVYLHYYITWLPVMGMLAAAFGHLWLTGLAKFSVPAPLGGGAPTPRVAHLLALLTVLLPLTPLAGRIAEDWAFPEAISPTYDLVNDYISRTTRPGDTVLVWGALPVFNVLSSRRAPTRYIYQYPLYTPGYQRPELVTQFITDLNARRPLLIIDASPLDPTVPPLTADLPRWSSKRGRYRLMPEMQEAYRYILRHYRPVVALGGEGVRIFRDHPDVSD